jgi:hypothetical protein
MRSYVGWVLWDQRSDAAGWCVQAELLVGLGAQSRCYSSEESTLSKNAAPKR